MSAFANDDVMDAALDVIALCNIMTVCSAQPTTRAEAISTFKLADVAMVPADFVKADGDMDGRKVTIGPKNGVPIDANGTATRIALCDDTRLLYVTDCVSQVLTAGNTLSVPAWKAEIGDPALI